jgi:hypothetical protein
MARKVRQALVGNDLTATCYGEGSLHETCRDGLFARPNYQSLNMIRPTLQCVSHLPDVLCALINTSNSGAMAGVVVENGLDMVGLYAEFAQLCGAGST